MANCGSRSAQNSLFYQAIEAVLGGWTALQLAVQHGFGGLHSEEKARWMVAVIEQWFLENNGIETYELEDFIAEIMTSEFDTVTDDNSIPEVAKSICGYFRLYQDGKGDEIRSQLPQLPKANLDLCKQDVCHDEDMDESPDPSEVANHMQHLHLNHSNTGQPTPPGDDDMGEDKPDQKPEEDDGWQCVKRKGKNR
ncbi:pre-rRNA-processing protein TSR2 homolog [Lineus longissimus]|uniref:pre-rRNA-processing protein TSR2 homolog n=1 Tax=Lineus longissimus TaxID=88925 RepID=UPI002B4E1877